MAGPSAQPKAVPRDSQNTPLPLTPSAAALAVTYDTTVSTATDVTLNAATTIIEVSALTQGIFMRYAATASSSNFDEFIQAGSTRHYVIPTGVSVISFIEQAASAVLVLIQK